MDDTSVLLAVLLNQNNCCRFSKGSAGYWWYHMAQYIFRFMGCSSTTRAKGRNWFVKKSCLLLTIDLIFLLKIKLLRGETRKKKKKLIKVSSSFLFWGAWGLGLYSPHGLYMCCINLKERKKKYPTSSHCNILIKLGQALENLLVLKLIFFYSLVIYLCTIYCITNTWNKNGEWARNLITY